MNYQPLYCSLIFPGLPWLVTTRIFLMHSQVLWAIPSCASYSQLVQGLNVLTLPMLRLLFYKAQGRKDYLKTI